jgi:RimJ/RimL family protein N-acetyltransferase
MNWINHKTFLNGQVIDLIPLEKEHFAELEKLSKDKRIWEFYVMDGTDSEKFLATLNLAITEREKGTQFPFVIYHKQQKKIIGGTRFLDIQPAHKKLEIGWTWLHPDYWATEINFECKLLLLTFCFENLKAVRVQLKTDENNLRSRKAIEKIGGQYEGILRNDKLRDNGTRRNSAYYSILDSEWENLKPKLKRLYEGKKNIKQ